MAAFGSEGIVKLFSNPARLPLVLMTIFAFSLSDTFDTLGTFIGTGRKTGIFSAEDERMLEEGSGSSSKMDKALFADAIGTSIGAIFGTSNTTTYVEDKTIDYGKEIVESNGSEGKIVTTTPKIVNELDGTVTDGKPTEKETPMVPKVVKVGTKPTVVETTTPYTTRYVEDNTKDKDYREVTRPGKSGKTTTTTTYTLDPNTGAVTPNEPTTITEEAVEEVITVGTKPKVEAPKVEAPKVEAPKIEVPKSKTPTEQSTKETSQIPTSVASKREELPNTGTEDHANLVVLGLLGVLSGFGFLAHKKKEVEK